MRMVATTARGDKSAIGAMHRRRLARMDTAKAVKAAAHQLARLIYAMLTRGEEYVAHDLAAWEEERRDRMVASMVGAMRMEVARAVRLPLGACFPLHQQKILPPLDLARGRESISAARPITGRAADFALATGA